jgi:PAS domain S-box-containing protein
VANERILVVDDEKGVVRSCVRILEREGFSVLGKTDSLSVSKLLMQETFDLILSDIRMPKMDGLELLKVAKEIDPHITVVLITGYGTLEDAINAIRLGAQGFIMKPFEPEELIASIKANLSRRALVRDSLRLQTLLPLLEINQILQVSGGEISLIRRILQITYGAIGATRIAWLSYYSSSKTDQNKEAHQNLIETAVLPKNHPHSQLPDEAMATVVATARPVWVLADGTLSDDRTGYPNIVGALVPLIIKGEVAGILTAETGSDSQTGPFGQIGLDLLSVLAGQLAIIIENVQLFQQTEALRTFNEDIIQNMTNGLIAIDQHHRITAFNPAASLMFGCQMDKVLHQPLSKVINEPEALVEIFNKTLTTGKTHAHREITLPHHDGRDLSISVSTAPLSGENGWPKIVGVVGVLEDLSEIKALEAERRRLDRLAALGEMAAVVAHEIRNPVAGIAAGVEYLTRNAPEGSPEYEGGLMIQSEVERVNRILEDILFVARPLQLNLSYQALPDIIENVIQRCQAQIKASQVVTCSKHGENLPLLNLDRQRLEQVFTNLIINATQAMREGGQLSLQSNFDLNSDGKELQKVAVLITDTGPGIPTDIQQRIFEPFFTTKARGSGLGLSVARRIIEEHGGTIDVESEERKGTQFIIKLPLG